MNKDYNYSNNSKEEICDVELEQQVKDILKLQSNISKGQNLLELGLTSLQVMKLMGQWKKKGIAIKFTDLISNPTLESWLKIINGKINEKEETVLLEENISMYEPFELTDVQYAYWIGRSEEQYLGGVGCHGYMEIEGENIDIERLKYSWEKLINHHPMLRVKYLSNGKQQVMKRAFSTNVLVNDFSDCNECELKEKLFGIREKLSHRLLRIDEGEVAALQVSLLPHRKTRIHFDIDLIVADVQSFQIILRDLAAIYNRDEEPKAPKEWNFAEYINLENKRLLESKKRDKEFWLNRIEKLPKAPKLPVKSSKNIINGNRFKRRKYIFKNGQFNKLKDIAAENKVTVAMVLLTAYINVIRKWSENKNFLMNIPLFNRDSIQSGIEDVVADFTSILLLEAKYESNISFLSQVRAIQKQFHEDMNHTAFSGIEIQRELAKRNPGENTFAPVVFSCNLGVPLINEEFKQSFGEINYMISQTPQVWLDFQVFDMDEGLLCIWDSIDDLFEDGVLDEAFSLFKAHILWLIEDKERWNQIFNLRSDSQKDRIEKIRKFKFKEERECIHTEIFNIAERTPDRIALINDRTDKKVTYEELTEKALIIAQNLQEKGVKAGDNIAISMERGEEQIEAILGILSVGACYVPISLSQPAIRLRYILEKAKINYLVCSQKYTSKFATIKNLNTVIYEDVNKGDIRREIKEISPENSAYVIFTSGSTGDPKGVEITHKAALNTIKDVNKRYGISNQDKLLAVSSFDFDLSVYDIFGVLNTGGILVLISEEDRRNACYWLDTIKKYDITVWNSVPVLLNMLLIEAESKKLELSSLRTVMLSGDWISLDIPERLRKIAPNSRLFAMGGATEASIWSNYFEVTLPLDKNLKSIPYGKALKNQLYRVVDSEGNDCPNWVPGELLIGGAGLAKSYIGDKELTDNKFIIKDGLRFYKTGDLGRYMNNGDIEFLGRKDFQVKIRGHRIELGEIEAVLDENPNIKKSVVGTVENSSGNKSLIGYVICNECDELHDEKLKDKNLIEDRWNNILKSEIESEECLSNDYYSYEKLNNNLALQYICEMLRRIGVLSFKDEENLRENITETVCTRYKKLVNTWIDELIKNNIMYEENGVLINKVDFLSIDDDKDYSIWNKQKEKFKSFLKIYLDNSSKLLKGELDPIELFLSNKYQSPEKLMNSLPGAEYKINRTIEMLKNIVDRNKRCLRIMEIGSRDLDNTKRILDKVGSGIEYICTDSSKYFLDKAKEEFRDYSFVKYMKLDINENVGKQRAFKDSYDVIIAKNSIHRALDLNKSLNYISKLLASDGIFINLEMTHNTPMQLVSTAFLEDGFTNFKDMRQGECKPLLSTTSWKCILEKAGFKKIKVFPEENESIKAFNQSIIIAQGKDKVIKEFNYSKLITFMKDRLPEYMIPSKIIELEDIPITSNGKVDRKSLFKSFVLVEEDENKDQIVEPRTDVERKLAKIWSETLNISQVGLYSNYFQLGGDSLIATKLNSLIREKFNVEMSLEVIFKNAVLSEMAEAIEKLSKENNLLENKITLPELIIDKENIYEPFPLTDVQQAYWLGRSGAYALGDVSTHCYFEMDCNKNLDIKQLSLAWNKLIKANGMMRAIILENGESQKILENVPYYDIYKYSLNNIDENRIESKLLSIRHEMENQKFDTNKWPLFDIRASVINNDKVRIHISFDNIIFDGWSIFHLFSEWKKLYENQQLEADELNVSFRDYVIASNKIKDTDLYKKDLNYWNEKLEKIYPAPSIPISKRPELLKEQKFTRYQERIPRSQWKKLKDVALNNGITPSGLLIAAYSETLARWSETPKFTINLTTFSRLPFDEEVKRLVGDFTSLTLLSLDMSKGNTFVERVKNLQEELWNNLGHSYVSGVYVERELQRSANTQGNGVMPIVFTSGLGIEENLKDGAYLGKLNYGLSQTPQVWLDHQVSEQNGELLLVWDCIEEIFPKDMIVNMFNAYVSLLKKLAEDSSIIFENISNLIEISNEELEEKSEESISNETLVSLFDKQVNKNPNNSALITENDSFTYKEVNNMAKYVSKALINNSVKLGSLVAVLMEKGFEQVPAILGILKSGAAYLPIDISNPIERIENILEDAKVENVIVSEGTQLSDVLLSKYNKIILSKDSKYSGELKIDREVMPKDLAYVIYTSGSTGKPKGVMIDHRGAVNTILDINERLSIGEKDRSIALSNLYFDLSVYDIFGMLAAGGAVVIPSKGLEKDPSHWLKLIKSCKVSLWNTVPAFMKMFVEYLSMLSTEEFEVNTLRNVLLSGDWIELDIPDKVKKYFRSCNVYGLGGATEASIWSNIFKIEKIKKEWSSIPYGKALKNQRYYILNNNMEPCPKYTIGTLYIGGIGVAKGYWENEKLTKERFVRYPLTDEIIYNTGDLGRYMEDGNIEFLGRKDYQVKLRGYRIELGEVEHHLKRLSYIKDAVADVIKPGSSEILTVYIVTDNIDYKFDTERCKKDLNDKLPKYMIPTKFIIIDKMPLSTNGKVDRKKLKTLAQEDFNIRNEKDIKKPSTDIENRLAEIWNEILCYKEISIDHNFYEYGGDSLKAVKFINILRSEFHINLSLKEFSDYPTIKSISDLIELELSENDEGEI